MADGVTMQSGTLASPAAGTEVATDDAGADGHVQIVKLAISTDGSATVIPADATNGLDVDVTRLPALAAGSAEIGTVGVVDAAGDRLAVNADGSINVSGSFSAGASTTRVTATPTISTSAYAAKDAVGALMTFSSINSSSARAVRIKTLQLVDKAQQKASLDLILFRASIAAPSDNAVFDPTDAELSDYVGTIRVVQADYDDFNDNCVAHVELPGTGLQVTPSATALYGVLVARTTPTYATTSDIVVALEVEQI